MYGYDQFDQQMVEDRVAQFRDQVARRLSGELTEDQFKPLRLMNGLYLQLHAYMLRVAIPYGVLSAAQVRKLADIGRKYDRAYGHFTTRQNIQFNWIKLEDAPDILAELADAGMHAIQTSGNCIRNVTADQYAGVIEEEIEDSRIWAEVIRQWSTFHPEFSFLPRKFKIGVTGSAVDRTAVRFHDIGLILKQDTYGDIGFEVVVGGGQGRTPMIGKTIQPFLPKQHLLSYLEAILRVYNLMGRRDNKYKARIKILVHELGIDRFRKLVEKEWATTKKGGVDFPQAEYERIGSHFGLPAYEVLPGQDDLVDQMRRDSGSFDRWIRLNTTEHKVPRIRRGERKFKIAGGSAGDITADQLDLIADLAERFSFSEVRTTHEQNLVFPHVKLSDTYNLFQELQSAGLGSTNLGLISDIVCCPGLDYCSLANARSIPVSLRISERFENLNEQENIGELRLKMSGCINACGHHHVGHIGILGVDRQGEEYYQLTLGGASGEDASIGKIIGPAFSADDVVDAVDDLIRVYLDVRIDGERFIDTYRRVGEVPFKSRLYGEHHDAAA